jgi:pSer/pThr/pTyr-binding forkhead associated (FHA) protein
VGAARFTLFFLDRSIPMPQGTTIVVGRTPECDVVLANDMSVSRKHAKFVAGENAITVEDVGSRNGTLVNGDAVSGTRELRTLDRVLVGGHVFQVLDAREAGRTLRERPRAPRSSGAPAANDEEPTGAQTPTELLTACSAELARGDLPKAEILGHRLAGTISIALSGPRPPEPAQLARATEIWLELARVRADGIWIDYVLDAHGRARRVLPAQAVETIARVLPHMRLTGRGSLGKYVTAMSGAEVEPSEKTQIDLLANIARMEPDA